MIAFALPLLAGLMSAPLQDADPTTLPTREIAECTAEITHLAVDADGKRLLTATRDGRLRAWSYAKGEILWNVSISSEPVGDEPVGIDIGDETVVYTIYAPSVTELDAATGLKTHAVGGPRIQSLAKAMVGDPRDRWAWIGTGDGYMVRLVPKNVHGYSQRNMENGGVTRIARDADGDLLAVAGADKTIRFVNAKSANPDDKKILAGHAAAITALAFDGKAAVLVSGAEDGELRVWRVSSGKTLNTLNVHSAPIRAVACDAKGRWMASGDQSGAVKVWDLKKCVEVATVTAGAGVRALAFLDGGKTLALADGATHLTLIDLSTL